MKKKIWIIVLAIIICVIGLFFFFKEESFSKKIESIDANMNAYKLKGDMEIVKGEDCKSYALEVAYKHDELDYFKVSITDKELNQTQVILRNKEGVFVLTPTLNQIFKFEGDWPLNTLKPYLIQSIHEVLKKEDCVVEKQDNGYVAKSSVVYPNNSTYKKQEMFFNKEGKIEQLRIYNEEDILQLQIAFKDVDYHSKIKKSYFDVPKEMETSVSGSAVLEEQLPLYPMQVYDASLKNVSSVEVATGVKHILEYEGDRNFTIVEALPSYSENIDTVVMSGSFIDTIDAFGFYDGNHMQMMVQGVEYTIYSEELTPEEMTHILSSMQVVVLK